ncbi:MAG: hypothetical protein B6I20_05360 [Bacteroidetes bacterium 4572_117]|nr:MAG: hypothetical protein B6I20_05360 [Bacteroidetes bacterium 4572_117]
MNTIAFLKYGAFFSFILFLANNSLNAQNDDIVSFGDDSIYQEYFLGFNLNSNMNGGLVNFALVKPLPNGKNEIILLTKDSFVKQALGKQKSNGNPKKINYFEFYKIKNPAIIDHLWKLRYKTYPYFTGRKMDPGWSENEEVPFLPTKTQMAILRGFGIDRFSDYIYDKEAFRLLSSMEDPEWVQNYRKSY